MLTENKSYILVLLAILMLVNVACQTTAEQDENYSQENWDNQPLAQEQNSTTANDQGEAEGNSINSVEVNNSATETVANSTEGNFDATGEDFASENNFINDTEPVTENVVENSLNKEILESRGAGSSTIPEVPLEVSETLAQLWWVGQWYNQERKKVSVEIITRGLPKYEVYRELNQQNQPEMVIRFQKTKMRPKIRRPLDANEFRSPVSYIRLRENPDAGWTDVILTFRDPVKTTLYSKNGNVVISAPIPPRYLNPGQVAVLPDEQATLLASVDIMPQLESGSDLPDGGDIQDQYYQTQDVLQSGSADNNQGAENQGNGGSDFVTDDLDNVTDDLDADLDSEFIEEEEEILLNDSQSFNKNKNTSLKITKLFSGNINGVAQSNIDEDLDQFADTEDPFEGNSDASLEPNDGSPVEAVADDIPLGDEGSTTREVMTNGVGAEPIGTSVAKLSRADLTQTVTLDFRNAPFGEVVRALSRDNNISFTLAPEVTDRKIFLSLENVPWDQALKALLESNSLGMVKLSEKLVRIDTIENIASERDKLERMKQTVNRLIDTKILVMRLNHAKVEDIRPLIDSLLRGFSTSNNTAANNGDANNHNRNRANRNAGADVDSRLRIESDTRTNSLIVEAIPTQLAKVKVLVERLDMETPQVEIVSRVVEMNRSNNFGYGINWGLPFKWEGNNGLGFGTLTFPSFFKSAWAVDPGLTAEETFRVGARIGSIGSGVDIDAILNFSETSNQAKIVQTNRVVTLDNIAASVSGGSSEFFIINGTAEQAGSVQAVQYQISLGVTPQVTAEGGIVMAVDLQTSVPQQSASSSAGVGAANTRSLTTSLQVDNGETAVIGGLWDSTRGSTERAVPFFSKIPFIGALFRNRTKSSRETDMLMMITPKILNGARLSGSSAKEGTFDVADSSLSDSEPVYEEQEADETEGVSEEQFQEQVDSEDGEFIEQEEQY